MRAAVPVLLLLSALALPTDGNAQVYRSETAPPAVTAANAPWQVNGEPLFHAGSFYYPAGATVFFDGKVMVRTGSYGGVPIYADVTLEPYSIVLVPVGRGLMQPYERRRDGELAGTVGSRVPSFPIARDVETSAGLEFEREPSRVLDGGARGIDPDYVLVPRSALADRRPVPQPDEPFVAAGAVMVSPPARTASSAPSVALPVRSSVEGMWVDFGGARWFSAGKSVARDSAQFEAVGDYRGFPVYRERGGPESRIYVTIVKDGPLAPFERR